MKKITYRDGLISFQIPKDWIEEYEENGSGTFYEDSQESGTLRVNVLTVNEKDTDETDKNLIHSFKASISSKNAVEITDEYDSLKGDTIIESLCRTQENDILINIYRFDCIHKTNKSDYLIAMFTWTIKTEFEKLDNYADDLKMIQNNIMNLTFGR